MLEGDRVYLETVFPILVNGRIVVPVGSWVAGTVTQIKKPGRVKRKGERGRGKEEEPAKGLGRLRQQLSGWWNDLLENAKKK